jgi:hypothetical protein
MCIPVALAVAGGLAGAAGSVIQGNAQAKAYEQQAQVAQQNARLAELQGERELERGAREEQRFRRQQRQFQGTQRAALAASGVQMGGSALSVLADTAQGIEEDAAMLRFNTLQNKWERDAQAVNFINEANAARANASNARNAGRIGAFTTLLTSGLNIAGMTAGVPTGSNVAKNGAIKLSVPNTPLLRGPNQLGYRYRYDVAGTYL